MAAVTDLQKTSVIMKLNNGTKEGKIVTVNLSLGALDVNGYDDQKALNIINLLSPCLDKDIYETQKINVYTLDNEE